jgi:putative peptidoglycan lipid II flippase
MIMVCVVAILAGVLNVHRHFACPAAAPVVLNIFIISTLLISGAFLDIPAEQMVFAVAVSVLIAGIIQIAMQLWALKNRSVKIRLRLDLHAEGLKKLLFLMAPMIIGLTATQINTLADDIIAWCLSGSVEKGNFFMLFGNKINYPLWRGSVSHLYFSQRLYQMPLGVLGISLATAVFPVMSSYAAAKDYNGLADSITKGLKVVIFLALPATLGLIIVRRPLVAAILERGKFTNTDTIKTGWTLCFYALGLSGFFAQQILTRAFYSLQESKVPMQTAFSAVALNLALNLTLIWFMGTAGLALSTAAASYLQVILLTKALSARLSSIKWRNLAITAAKSLLASLTMAAAVAAMLWFLKNLPKDTISDIIRLSAAVPTGAAVYWFAAKTLGINTEDFLRKTPR